MHALALAALVCAAGAAAIAQPVATFSYLPDGCVSANDMSPDGRFIVGGYDSDGDGFSDGSYLYDTALGTVETIASGAIATGLELVVAVSNDGSTATGSVPFDEFSSTAAVWTQPTGLVSIGHLPNALQCPSLSTGYEISGDGTTVVGLSWDGCDAHAIKWTQSGGMVGLEHLVNGSNRASVVNHDGTVIAGFCQGNFSRSPAVWDGVTGDGMLLDPNAYSVGEVHGMSDDGTVLLVEYGDAANPTKDGYLDAHTWTASGGFELIGTGSISGGWSGIPMDIAEETGTIVGFDILLGNRRAWIRHADQGGIVELVSFVESHGGDVPDGQPLQVCQAITNDGTRIIGHGGTANAWMITLEYPCAADVNGDGVLDNGDIGAFVALFLASDLAADFNADGILDNGDIGAFVASFLAGC
ncbi:MAG: GC-type dockerin domain-anchored protein [Phycisphaerales bacterium JB040]